MKAFEAVEAFDAAETGTSDGRMREEIRLVSREASSCRK